MVMEMFQEINSGILPRFCRLLILSIVLLLLISPILAEKLTEWVVAEGEGKTQEEALQNARNNAVRSVVGTRALTALSIFESSSNDAGQAVKVRQRSTFVLTRGLVVKEDILNGALRRKGEGLGAVPYYWVQMKAEVLDLGTPDPSFQVELELEPVKETYYHGQGVVIRVSANDTCHVTLLALSARNEVYLLLPNKYDREGVLVPCSPIRLETVMTCQLDLDVVPEQLLAIATRGKSGFVSPEELSTWTIIPSETGDKYLAANLVGTTERFAEWLIQLSADNWTMDRVQYVITK